MTMRKEVLARTVVIILVVAALAIPTLGWWTRATWVEVHARMPEAGGWSPSNLTVQVGEPLRLRLTSDDVTHSFAIGQDDRPPVDVLPGEITEVVLTFDQPGTYTFYCTRWCGPNHWRMRGTITVTGDDPVGADPSTPPLYQQLGLDLDAPRQPLALDLERQPSAENGALLAARLPDPQLAEYQSLDYYQSHSPYQVWNALRADPATVNLGTPQVWDLVAWLWQQHTTPTQLAVGENLYQRDCAACHGVDGEGDGVFALDSTLPLDGEMDSGQTLQTPVNFRDVDVMLGANSALLQGKILRGGMGSGMPSWGLIYTEEQTWALVDYLWTFQFQYFEE